MCNGRPRALLVAVWQGIAVAPGVEEIDAVSAREQSSHSGRSAIPNYCRAHQEPRLFPWCATVPVPANHKRPAVQRKMLKQRIR